MFACLSPSFKNLRIKKGEYLLVFCLCLFLAFISFIWSKFQNIFMVNFSFISFEPRAIGGYLSLRWISNHFCSNSAEPRTIDGYFHFCEQMENKLTHKNQNQQQQYFDKVFTFFPFSCCHIFIRWCLSWLIVRFFCLMHWWWTRRRFCLCWFFDFFWHIHFWRRRRWWTRQRWWRRRFWFRTRWSWWWRRSTFKNSLNHRASGAFAR